MNAAAETPPAAPLIELRDVTRTFVTEGGVAVQALRGVSLSIRAGEFVSIVGQSGSGKSTLMHLIGCLDLPTGGTYLIGGRDVRSFDPNGLAWLRREVFGFVFQGYNLLPTASAEENVEIPAIYAGLAQGRRRYRALELLGSLGLDDRADHLPSQLSGGEQQRVSVARALMNGGRVILADEPTGALDSGSSSELMALLAHLSRQGHTVIVITHDPVVAKHANRQIELLDGRVIGDTGSHSAASAGQERLPSFDTPDDGAQTASSLSDMWEAVRMAMRSLRTNVFRTFLTLLGVVIGVASVVTLLAVGEGAKDQIVNEMTEAGANRLSVWGDSSRGGPGHFTFEDLDAVANEIPNVHAVLPQVSGNETLRYGNVDREGVRIEGAFHDYPEADNWPVASGTFISEQDNSSLATVVVLGASVADELFPDGDAVGKYILIRNTPLLVIGTMTRKGGGAFGDRDNIAFVPARTGAIRIFGWETLWGFQVRVRDTALNDQTESGIRALLKARHEVEDFNIFNAIEMQEQMGEAMAMATVILGAIGSIALLVGGIGIMNIMLISVTERTREIGIRLATGARRSDILVQFLVEAVVVSAVGGVVGIAAGIGIGGLLRVIVPEMWVSFTGLPMIVAFSCAAATGLVFGFAPARNAARLNPVDALAHD